ncbi:MAG: DUF2029 domain-containing protein [Candidatus Riflebacteria bacterium]|nr:DUF2029 domain-containing protein [Candidatus Riflebacteria bacterium]
MSQKRPWLAGAVFALTLHLKPFGWILLFWGIARKQWSFLFSTIGCFALLLLLPMPFIGCEETLRDWHGFGREMFILHGGQLSLLKPENHTFASLVTRWLHLNYILNDAALNFFGNACPILLLGTPFFMVLSSKYSSPVVSDITPGNPNRIISAENNPMREAAWFLAAVPLIGPPEYKYYQLAIPLTWFVLADWPTLNRNTKFALILGLTGFGINIYDLWGREISHFLSDISIVAFGGTAIYLCGFESGIGRYNISDLNLIPASEPRPFFVQVSQVKASVSSSALSKPWFRKLGGAILLSGFIALTFMEWRNLQTRMVCRVCEEENSPDEAHCKNCGSSSLAPYCLRIEEIQRRDHAATILCLHVSSISEARPALRNDPGLAPVFEKLLREFPDLTREDALILASESIQRASQQNSMIQR